jgi:YjbE family integral membrane protein
MEEFLTAHFWVAVGQIILVDILLGGDNAVVIALACRRLPPAQRMKGVIWGTVGAIVLRVILIAFALALLQVPFLKLIGALLLVWIGVKLIAPPPDDHSGIQSSDKLWVAIRTIIVADLVMSIDNVIAIAAAAQVAGEKHELLLVIFGLLVSIPIIIGGSQIIMRVMDRFPVIITLGGMLLGWIAGSMAHTDPVLQSYLPQDRLWHYGLAAVGALLVLALGRAMLHRRASAAAPG